MSGFNQNLLRDAAGAFFGSDYLRDFRHASKTFRSNSYQNAPKLKFLFHTYFDINPEAMTGFYRRGVGDIDFKTNFGLLVKNIQLPNYTFDTTTLNQYNRKRIVQTKLKYDPVEVTFHDDNGDQINQLWEAYYSYYYHDTVNPNVQFGGSRGQAGTGPNFYNNRNLYDPSIEGDENWGYDGRTLARRATDNSPVKKPFFKNITVFGFNQHNFTAYTLVNPMITAFSHDNYDYSEGGGIMENSMTIDYETVVYNYGALDGRDPGNIVTGFGDRETYDRRVSPIAVPGANGTILGQGGLVDGVAGTIDALRQGDIVRAIQIGGRTVQTARRVDLRRTASGELTNILIEGIQDTPNRRGLPFDFPAPGSTPGNLGTAGAPSGDGAVDAPEQLTDELPAGIQTNGNPNLRNPDIRLA